MTHRIKITKSELFFLVFYQCKHMMDVQAQLLNRHRIDIEWVKDLDILTSRRPLISSPSSCDFQLLNIYSSLCERMIM